MKETHELVASNTTAVHPNFKQEAPEVAPVMELIVQSKLSTLITGQETYKFVKLSLLFFSKLVDVIIVVHKKMIEVIRDKNWQVIKMFGSKKRKATEKIGLLTFV